MDIKELQRSIAPQILALENHSLYKKIDNIEKLKFFMERHVYAVFDFMSLAKALQNEFAPIQTIWLPPKDPQLSRFVNEIILAEESDECNGETYSHFEMYLKAMNEVNADSDLVSHFINCVRGEGVNCALTKCEIPSSAKEFSQYTFDLVSNGQIHEIASSFCFGREKVIPLMFEKILQKINIKPSDAPLFHTYLNRHIEIDGDSHGPMALKIIESLCGNNLQHWEEAKHSAIIALDKRLKFWDMVSEEL
jgi:hypothetical protein